MIPFPETADIQFSLPDHFVVVRQPEMRSLLTIGFDPRFQIRSGERILHVEQSHHNTFCWDWLEHLAQMWTNILTQIRQHAPENCQGCRRLLIQFIERSTRQLLEVLERAIGGDGHFLPAGSGCPAGCCNDQRRIMSRACRSSIGSPARGMGDET